MELLDRSRPAAGRAGVLDTDDACLTAVGAGDERAFTDLVGRWSSLLLDLAACWSARPRSDVEEAVRATWIRVVRESPAFRTPPGARAWLCRALLEEVRSRGWLVGDAHTYRTARPAPSVEPERFLPESHEQWPGHWASPPTPWARDGGARGPSREDVVAAVGELPEPNRVVVGLRDVAGCELLDIVRVLGVPARQGRALLQGGRARIRTALDAGLAV